MSSFHAQVDNLLINLRNGKTLSEGEIKLLRRVYGDKWFQILGYPEPKKPVRRHWFAKLLGLL